MRSSRDAEARHAARFGTGPLPTDARVATDHYEFTMRGRWLPFAGTPRVVFGDAGARHIVEMTVLRTEASEETVIPQRFPGAHATSVMKIGGRLVHLVTRRDAYFVVTAAVVADHGSVYELTCSSPDTATGVTDDACVQVLMSLRVY